MQVIDWRCALKRKLWRNEGAGWTREETKKVCGFTWSLASIQDLKETLHVSEIHVECAYELFEWDMEEECINSPVPIPTRWWLHHRCDFLALPVCQSPTQVSDKIWSRKWEYPVQLSKRLQFTLALSWFHSNDPDEKVRQEDMKWVTGSIPYI